MTQSEHITTGTGKVSWWHQGSDGSRAGLGHRANAISYVAADLIVRLVAGDVSYAPTYVGFIFGAAAMVSDPVFLSSYPRLQDWNGIATSLYGKNANVLLAPIASTTFALDKSRSSEANYTGNVLRISSNSSASGVLALVGSGYRTSLEDGDLFYSTVLLARRQTVGGSYQYLPFSRASLKTSSSYPAQLPGLAFGIDWDITFY